MNKTIIVTSTINVPTFLRTLCENALQHNRKDFSVIVIGDMKTPDEAKEYCKGLVTEFGIEIKYLDIDDQREAFKDYKILWDIIPFNNNVRKMIGTFLAYVEGCDRVIMIDDDNYATRHDYIGFHDIVGSTVEVDLMKSESGWYNICETMIEKNRIPFYPRGYPWSKRFSDSNKAKKINQKSKVVVNGGLVLGDPDIDAVSRLFWPIEVVAIDSGFDPHFGLHPGTWAPFNDQNTAISRELIPLYYKPPAVLRNADIWTSYIIARITEHMGDVIAFGQPLVTQVRNVHDLREDYRLEELHNRATDRFVSLLRKIELSETSYIDCMGELITKCLQEITPDSDIFDNKDDDDNASRHAHMPSSGDIIKANRDEADLIKTFFLEYKIWHNVITEII